jgi:hypothetical protein
MTLREFNKELKKRGSQLTYIYLGYYTSSKGYKERHYQAFYGDTEMSMYEPITKDKFEQIINDMDMEEEMNNYIEEYR